MPNIYEPRTMGTLIERIPKTTTFLRDTFFRNVETFPTKKIDVDFKKGNRQMAPFVHPKRGGKTINNEGYQTNSYTPPLMAPNILTTVDDLLKRLAGENPYSGKTPAERAIEKLGKDFIKLEEMIVRREEWMAAQAIFTGQIPIIGEGLNEVIDFGFTNKKTLATNKWGTANADPIADLKAWREEVQEKGFVNCDICIMASDVASAFLKSDKVMKMLDVKAYDLAVIKPKELPNGATYLGTIHEIALDIYQYNEFYLDDWTDPTTPAQKPLVPSKTLALMSTGAEYSRYYGAITIVDEDTKDFITIEGEMVPETWIKRNPARRFLQLNSRFLPVPHEVDSWLVAEVL